MSPVAISAAEKFSFILSSSFPIQVEVTDQSQETVVLVQIISIVEPVVPDPSQLSVDELLAQLRKSTDASDKVDLIERVISKLNAADKSDKTAQIKARQQLL